MNYPNGPGARGERVPIEKKCAAPTGIGDGAKISLQRPCDPSTSRGVFVKRDAGPVNPDRANKLAGTVIPFPASRSRASISNGPVHRLLRTTYLNRPLDPRPALARMAIEKLWLRRMAEVEGNST